MRPWTAANWLGAATASLGVVGNLVLAFLSVAPFSTIHAFRIVLDLGVLAVCGVALLRASRDQPWPAASAAVVLLVAAFFQVITFAQPFYLVAAALFVAAARMAPSQPGASRALVLVAAAVGILWSVLLAFAWLPGARYCESCHWLPWEASRVVLALVPLAGLVVAALWPRRAPVAST